MGAVGRDRIISLCCVTVSIILTSIHSGPSGVSLPATQQTTRAPDQQQVNQRSPPLVPNAPDTHGSNAGPSAPLQVRLSDPDWFNKDESEALPDNVVAADAMW